MGGGVPALLLIFGLMLSGLMLGVGLGWCVIHRSLFNKVEMKRSDNKVGSNAMSYDTQHVVAKTGVENQNLDAQDIANLKKLLHLFCHQSGRPALQQLKNYLASTMKGKCIHLDQMQKVFAHEESNSIVGGLNDEQKSKFVAELREICGDAFIAQKVKTQYTQSPVRSSSRQ